MNERSGICRALSIKPRWWWNCIGWIARRAEGKRKRCRSCPASRRTANGLRTRWGSPVRAPRRGRWRGGWVWHRARYGASIYGTWSVARPAGGSRRCDPWGGGFCGRLGNSVRKYSSSVSFLTSRQRKGIEAVCVDMWEPFRLSLEQWVPGGKIIYDKFHVLGHANDAV